jgi:hypothetical protein
VKNQSVPLLFWVQTKGNDAIKLVCKVGPNYWMVGLTDESEAILKDLAENAETSIGEEND